MTDELQKMGRKDMNKESITLNFFLTAARTNKEGWGMYGCMDG